MLHPKSSRPFWPDAMQTPPLGDSGLKPWSWALERLEKSHNYWIATSQSAGRPHLMIVWGIWWEDAFWFSTGAHTRKARNLAAHPYCIVATENAAEAVILEGSADRIDNRTIWRSLTAIYDRKYGGDLCALLESSGSLIFRVQPVLAFAQDEHAENFVDSVTRWNF